jgi:hypothetical protein
MLCVLFITMAELLPENIDMNELLMALKLLSSKDIGSNEKIFGVLTELISIIHMIKEHLCMASFSAVKTGENPGTLL